MKYVCTDTDEPVPPRTVTLEEHGEANLVEQTRRRGVANTVAEGGEQDLFSTNTHDKTLLADWAAADVAVL